MATEDDDGILTWADAIGVLILLALPYICIYFIIWRVWRGYRARTFQSLAVNVNPSSATVAPVRVLEINMKMNHGQHRRLPQAADAVQPVKYEGDCVAEMGLVVTLDEAMDHWDKGLAAWGAYEKAGHARPTRYRVDGRTPFVMISYNSKLKDKEAYPHGPESITALLLHLRAAGWQYVWWDWLVINEGVHQYVQADFEHAMTWAQNSAYEVAVLWPYARDAATYLSRPWCLSEILACTSRGAHTIYSYPGEMWVTREGASAGPCCEAMLYPRILTLESMYTLLYMLCGMIVGSWLGSSSLGVATLTGTMLGIMFNFAVLVGKQYVANKIGGGKLTNFNFIFPVDLIDHLSTSTEWKSDALNRMQLLNDLCEAGHLKGDMWDLGDTMSCGKLLGFEDPWRFSFEQATLKWSRNPMIPWEDKNLGRKQAFREPGKEHNASWLDGTASHADGELKAVSSTFTGTDILWWSEPRRNFSEDSSAIVAIFWIICTPMAPLQQRNATTFLKKPIIVGTEKIRLAYAAVCFCMCAAVALLTAFQASITLVCLLVLPFLAPHVLMAAGKLTLVSHAKTHTFCSQLAATHMVALLYVYILLPGSEKLPENFLYQVGSAWVVCQMLYSMAGFFDYSFKQAYSGRELFSSGRSVC